MKNEKVGGGEKRGGRIKRRSRRKVSDNQDQDVGKCIYEATASSKLQTKTQQYYSILFIY
jgi:hypothetical protein